jgi:dihydrolipoamide dehydrogenase
MGELQVEAEVLVIGGGPGGYAAAFRAADLGLDVTLVTEEAQLGGACLLRGCIPSKTLLSLAELIHTASDAAEMGIRFQDPEIDLDAVRDWKDKVIDKLSGGLDQLCEQRGINLVQARATFTGKDTVQLDTDSLERMSFKHAIVATGSRPVPLPESPFSDRIMDSGRALELRDIPKRLLIVGGGYVGLEMGMVYASLGSQVTLVEMTDRLMPNADADLVKPLNRRIKKLFAGVHLDTKVTGIQEEDDTVHVSFDGDTDVSQTTFDRVLVAIGRRPNTDEIGLETVGVECDEHGAIPVDAERRTTNRRIFAVGDAAGGMLLAHEAMYEGRVAAEVIAGQAAAFDARAIPAVVYTDPQIAWCGLTEQAAASQERKVAVARFPWRASGRAVSMAVTDGLTKLVFDPDTQQVLGMGVVGRHAEALIAEGVLAIEMGAVAQDLVLSIHPHPTLTETVGEAAAVFLGSPIHLPRRQA